MNIAELYCLCEVTWVWREHIVCNTLLSPWRCEGGPRGSEEISPGRSEAVPGLEAAEDRLVDSTGELRHRGLLLCGGEPPLLVPERGPEALFPLDVRAHDCLWSLTVSVSVLPQPPLAAHWPCLSLTHWDSRRAGQHTTVMQQQLHAAQYCQSCLSLVMGHFLCFVVEQITDIFLFPAQM